MHNDDDEMDDEDVSEDRSNKVCPGLCDQPRHGLIPLGKPKVRWLVGLGGYGLRFINREEELYWRFHHCSHSSSPWETPGREEGSPNTQFAQFNWKYVNMQILCEIPSSEEGSPKTQFAQFNWTILASKLI